MKEVQKEFLSEGLTCRGTLYLPDSQRPPVIVMANGLGAERTFRLPAYAKTFAQAGLAVFLFDYRNFGQSDGVPRNLINPRRHIIDFLHAVQFAKSLPEVSGERLGVWGTSFAGGHSLVVASKSRDVKAVVSQVPFVDGFSTTNSFPLSYQLQGLIHGLRDLATIVFRSNPHTVPIIARPNTFGLMNTPDSFDGFSVLVDKESNWNNAAPARICLTLPFYRPGKSAKKIDVPVLMQVAKKDSLIPFTAAVKTAKRIKDCRLTLLDIGHFEPYFGELFDRTVQQQLDFFKKYL